MENLNTYLPFVIIILSLVLVLLIIKNLIKGAKLESAINHFSYKVPENKEEDFISDVIHFEQKYAKSLEIVKAFDKDPTYYRQKLAEVIASELLKNDAVKIEIIEGEDTDKVKGELRYLIKI